MAPLNRSLASEGLNSPPLFEPFLQQAKQLQKIQGSGPVIVPIPAGNYQLKAPILIGPEHSGTRERPIVFQVTDPEQTTFSSARPLPPLKVGSEGYWHCQLPEGFVIDQVFANGQRAPLSRLPDTGYYIMAGVEQKTITAGSNSKIPAKAEHVITLTPNTAQQLKLLELGDTRLTALHKWNCTLRTGLHFKPEDQTLRSEGPGMAPWNPWKKGTRFFLENVHGTPLSPGHWKLKGRHFTYAPKPGETLANTTLSSPQLDKLLIIKGTTETPVSNIQFQGFHWTCSSINLPNGMPANQAAASIDAAIMLDHVANVHLIECKISNIGRYGIWFRNNCHNSGMRHCLIENLGAGGVRIGEPHLREKHPTSGIRIDNCIIRRGGRILPSAVAIWIGQSPNNRITHNEIYDFFYTGISVGWTWGYGKSHATNNKILFNHIYDIGQGMLSDMGAVYTLGISPGTEVSGNVVHDIQSHGYGGWGLYTDEGSTGITMENNLVYRTKCGGFHQHYGKENLIQNNIFVNQTQYQVQATRPEKHRSFTFTNNIISFERGTIYQGPWTSIQNKIDHNLIWGTHHKAITSPKGKLFAGRSWQDWRNSGRDQHSLIADPGFTNPNTDDYTPTNTEALQQIQFQVFDPKQAGPASALPAWMTQANSREEKPE